MQAGRTGYRVSGFGYGVWGHGDSEQGAQSPSGTQEQSRWRIVRMIEHDDTTARETDRAKIAQASLLPPYQ